MLLILKLFMACIIGILLECFTDEWYIIWKKSIIAHWPETKQKYGKNMLWKLAWKFLKKGGENIISQYFTYKLKYLVKIVLKNALKSIKKKKLMKNGMLVGMH